MVCFVYFNEMFRIQTCCNYILSAAVGFRGQEATCADPAFFCQFYLVLSLFYSLQSGSNGFIAEKTILNQGSRGVHYFPGVCQTFSRGSPNANVYRNPYTYLYFPGPLSPSGSAHGQCLHNGTIFITVPLLSIIVRH